MTTFIPPRNRWVKTKWSKELLDKQEDFLILPHRYSTGCILKATIKKISLVTPETQNTIISGTNNIDLIKNVVEESYCLVDWHPRDDLPDELKTNTGCKVELCVYDCGYFPTTRIEEPVLYGFYNIPWMAFCVGDVVLVMYEPNRHDIELRHRLIIVGLSSYDGVSGCDNDEGLLFGNPSTTDYMFIDGFEFISRTSDKYIRIFNCIDNIRPVNYNYFTDILSHGCLLNLETTETDSIVSIQQPVNIVEARSHRGLLLVDCSSESDLRCVNGVSYLRLVSVDSSLVFIDEYSADIGDISLIFPQGNTSQVYNHQGLVFCKSRIGINIDNNTKVISGCSVINNEKPSWSFDSLLTMTTTSPTDRSITMTETFIEPSTVMTCGDVSLLENYTFDATGSGSDKILNTIYGYSYLLELSAETITTRSRGFSVSSKTINCDIVTKKTYERISDYQYKQVKEKILGCELFYLYVDKTLSLIVWLELYRNVEIENYISASREYEPLSIKIKAIHRGNIITLFEKDYSRKTVTLPYAADGRIGIGFMLSSFVYHGGITTSVSATEKHATGSGEGERGTLKNVSDNSYLSSSHLGNIPLPFDNIYSPSFGGNEEPPVGDVVLSVHQQHHYYRKNIFYNSIDRLIEGCFGCIPFLRLQAGVRISANIFNVISDNIPIIKVKRSKHSDMFIVEMLNDDVPYNYDNYSKRFFICDGKLVLKDFNYNDFGGSGKYIEV